jgi:hypothetical protein
LGPSNIECATIPYAPAISVTPEALNESLNEGETSTQLLTITNSGLGSLDFDVNVILLSDQSDNTKTYPKATAENAAISGEHYTYEPSDAYMECMDGTIYGLLPDMVTSGAASSEAGPGYTCFQKIDAIGDFQTVGVWALNLFHDGISWNDCGTENPMGMTISFWENNQLTGEPGNLIYTEDVSLTRMETGELVFGAFPLYYYQVALASSVNMANGWVSIQGSTATVDDCWFLWKGALAGEADPYLQWDDATGLFTAGEYPLSICLGGEMGEPWLSVDPLFGTIEPDEDGFMELNANFNATDLEEGFHFASIVISSNDPFMPEVVIPVQLIVGALTHEIMFPEGWGAWSSYINPDARMSMEDVMAPVFDDMIITQYFSELYWPSTFPPGPGINTMGDFSNTHGYITKMNAEATLPITGFMADPTVMLNAGWNLLPVISTCDVDVTLLGDIPGFDVAWDIASPGGVYYPDYGIQDFDFMVPGSAYWVRMLEPGSFTFPECVLADNASAFKPYTFENTTDWEVNFSGVSHAVIFNEMAASNLLTGDIVGAFTSGGQCAGIAQVQGGSFALKAFADDITTLNADGFVEAEALSYKVYRAATNQEFILGVTYDVSAPNADGLFATNGLSVVTDLTMSVTSINNQMLNGLSVYPNPSTGIFNISVSNLDQDINYVIVNTRGQEILEAKLLQTQEIDLSTAPKGIYFIKFMNNEVLRIEKVVIK